jgi:hypothetical protein
MPLSKLDNFIKNTQGRILYVNPNDLDATDSIENQGNSLTQPFKTIQRALLEAARFSYVRGKDNDLFNRTTIMLYPGDHIVDNRPGFAIRNVGGVGKVVSPSGSETDATTTLNLTLTSNFDLTQENNILYKFNSVNGGVIVPRGTSIVGLDLRKTRIRPKYVPNPTDDNVGQSAILRLTGGCYFWQFTFLDGLDNELVYTDPQTFDTTNRSLPTFSHHKLSAFEFADGVNDVAGYSGLTDLSMYYYKLTHAFQSASGRPVSFQWPNEQGDFDKVRPEYEIVGALGVDPAIVTSMFAGDGATPTAQVTVTTQSPHGFTTGTPIKVRGVNISNYNISAFVTSVISDTSFTYQLPSFPQNLIATPDSSNATITIESDTVSGASPYIFNVSLRSVWGMQGLHGDGSKSTGFRSIVLAQYTAISLQKDDRAFVKYNEESRLYDGIVYTKVTGGDLASGSSSTSSATVYHLDSDAVYRSGWESTHVKLSNDAVFQIVSVFAIGFNKHFEALSGADASITNSNSNFGQIALVADGFKAAAFNRDDQGFITNVITPKEIAPREKQVNWLQIDVGLTTSVGISSHLYLFGYSDQDISPTFLTQGFKIGARHGETLYLPGSSGIGTLTATIQMPDNEVSSGSTIAYGSKSGIKEAAVTSGPTDNELTLASDIGLVTGESIKVISQTGDLPEGLEAHRTYYAIRVSATEIKVASSFSDALNDNEVSIVGGTALFVRSRVSDKVAGDIGHPIQFDTVNNNWFVHVNTNSDIYTGLSTFTSSSTSRSYVRRYDDTRGLDSKIYRVGYVIPKESQDARDPRQGYVLQLSSQTGFAQTGYAAATTLQRSDILYNRNNSFISTCSASGSVVTVRTDLPHGLDVGDKVIFTNIKSSTNAVGAANSGYNGEFTVTGVTDDMVFTTGTTDTDGVTHNPGTFTDTTGSRNLSLPRFERNDLQSNFFIYRNTTVQSYERDKSDGLYILELLDADYAPEVEFTAQKYKPNVEDYYPQFDRDNASANPPAAASYAKRAPIGAVVTNEQKNSLTRNTIDSLFRKVKAGKEVSAVDTTAGITTLTFSRRHGFNGALGITTITDNTTSHADGTYYNVKLLNDGTSTWQGATAKVFVSGGVIADVDIMNPGSGYASAQNLDIESIGGEVGIGTTTIAVNVGDVVQVTGVGTTATKHYRIDSIVSDTEIAIARTSTDPTILANSYVYNVGVAVTISSTTYDAPSGITTFTCSNPHNLIAGNKFELLNTSNARLGEFTVRERVGINTFTAITTDEVTSPYYLYKHGLEANEQSTSITEEFGGRFFAIYGGVSDQIVDALTSTGTAIKLPNVNLATTKKFALGDYIQVNREIMRVVSSELGGVGSDEITVVRAMFGTRAVAHDAGSRIQKIVPLPVELRRNSILRASGHTFEYLGYGPGNYSTGLPQVQTRTLTDLEEYLSQAQDRGGGIVVYTGLNNDGDFYIGNKKINSFTGTEETFNVPIPTTTGSEVNGASERFDELVITNSISVEGGENNNILSSFDGPVSFGNEVSADGDVTINGSLTLAGGLTIDPTATALATPTFGNIRIAQTDLSTIDVASGDITINAGMGASVGINTITTIDGDLYVTGNITAFFPSDRNLKDQIQIIADPDEKIKKLSGNSFIWNEKAGKGKEGQIDYGVIAQEVEKDFPELVVTDKNGVKKVRYEGLTPVMIEAIKDLIGRVEAIEGGRPNGPKPGAQMQIPPYPYPYPPYPYPYPPQQPPQEPQQ